MSFNVCKLSQVGTTITGKTPSKNNPEYWGDVMPFVTPTDYKNYGKKAYTSIRCLSDEGKENLKNKVLPIGSIMVTCIGSDLGKVAINEVPVVTNQQINAIIPNTNVYSSFLYYALRSKYRILKVLGGSGTAVPIINKSTFESIEIPSPPLQEQKAIAEVLSSLDNKIELLQKQNETLEALAQTLFRQWFIEEADDSWEECTIGRSAVIIKTSVKPEANPDKTFEHYSLPAYDNQQNPSLDLGIDIKSNKYKVINESVLISKLNPGTSRVWLVLDEAQENSICSTEFVVVKPDSKEWLFFIYCLLSSNDTSEYLGSCASGTSGSHQRIKPIDVLNINFNYNDIESIKRFGIHVQPFFEKVSMNRKSIRTLKQTRDTLLPKLMSGQLCVKLD